MTNTITETHLNPKVNLDAMRNGWIEGIEKRNPKLLVTITFPIDLPKTGEISSDKEYQRYFSIPRPETAITEGKERSSSPAITRKVNPNANIATNGIVDPKAM